GPTSASCVSNGGKPELPPVEFSAPFTACALEESSCGGTEVCLPPDLTGLCLIGDESQPCPEGFPKRRAVLLESGLDDARDCQCDCNALTVICMPAFELYKDGSCTTLDTPQPDPDCVGPADATPIEGLIYRPTPSGAGCSQGSSSFGTVTAGPASALCCADG